MANNYYNFTGGPFIPGTKARSDEVNTEFQAIVSAFDLLPTDTTALTRNTSTFAGSTGGTGNSFTVSMPTTRVSNQNGDEVVFIANRNNTGGSTLNVDGIGAVALVRSDGAALTADDLVSGRIYAARYDNANTRFQLMGPTKNAVTAAASAAASAASATASATEAMNWAQYPEDSLVPEGNLVDEYSAFHWSKKAEAWAASVNLPSIAGNALNVLRANAGETGLEYFDLTTQYYTESEVDALLAAYYTAAQLNAGQLDTRYYTETEVDSLLTAYYTSAQLDAGQLDTRYYTETEVDTLISGIFTSTHTWTATQTFNDSIFANNGILRGSVSDSLVLSGGDSALGSSGALMYLFGTSHATLPGQIRMLPGNNGTTGTVQLYSNTGSASVLCLETDHTLKGVLVDDLEIGEWSIDNAWSGIFHSGGTAGNYMICGNGANTLVGAGAASGDVFLRAGLNDATSQIRLFDGSQGYTFTEPGGNTHWQQRYSVRKAASETLVGPDTTPQNDDHLVLSNLPAGLYSFRLFLEITTNAAAGFRLDFTASGLSNSAMSATLKGFDGTSSSDMGSTTATPCVLSAASNGAQAVVVEGLVRFTSSTNSFQLTWAQATGDASNTVVLEDSYMIMERID